ncbi:MAG: ABC1 kinase family protein [Gemmatimonadota bacterium]
MAFEELGATATKFGQILSTRPDLLPPEYVTELSRLQDAAPSISFDAVKVVVEGELGRPLEDAYDSFDPEPLAAASIGQAHAAVLKDGVAVVVKVRRPGIVDEVREDLEILQNLAATANRRWEAAARYDLPTLAEEFSATFLDELDYLKEARNAERFAADLSDDPWVKVPRIYRELSTSRVLTLERLYGIKVSDPEGLESAGIDRVQVAERAARMLLEMVFEHGFFHADPHPGNFFIQPDGRIGLIDFGLVGRVDDRTREDLTSILVALARQDSRRLADAIIEIGVAAPDDGSRSLEEDLDALLAEYYGRSLGEVAIGPLIQRCLSTVRAHRLQLPARLALLLKTVVMSEGLGAQLDPDFRLAELMKPYAERLVLERFSPNVLAHRVGEGLGDLLYLGRELPGELHRVLRSASREGVRIAPPREELQKLERRLESARNRVVAAILLTGWIILLVLVSGFSGVFDGGRWLVPVVSALTLGGLMSGAILLRSRGGPR